MNTRRSHRMLASGLGALLSAVAAQPARAVDWPDVPVPDEASGEVVSDHMLYNGIAMRASRFRVAQSPQQVEQFYRKAWGDLVVATPAGSKTVLGHMTKSGYYITVELSGDANRTQGQIGVMEIPKRNLPADGVGKGFGRLPDTQVAEDIVYMDTPRHVRTLSMLNRYTPLQNQQYYARYFAGQGYSRDGSSSTCTASSPHCVSRFTRQDDRVTVTSSRGQTGTVIVAVVE
ncbi:hypothetical protein [Xanthomonas rydalmerensis]|uniref:Uncharacterized protein n=1 Tax=Xanthomonas rydalmerensis TaxID=3046274 RepID=A0ABZ0JN28_9XANT|nr:hypothetical protein [Xanthomonas sp. DM-2023]WOS41209.1 hypothetical protein QN243_01615 [Xanthomonas sp. DM-2023]WOS45394.1 hypothetical protein QN242_01615 [Xanthomonas sp. DM-2023]WOS49573.1 hypothetical protein QN240_01615 [Xanthomonas sp. DM-2023]WOS53753.1 hypothetical protein QN244_01615 [Xanthomonas sp. DM-2023]WOS57936.1 hypothetical protein QN245_01615 [Xanthomonas sp. DM-2023]